MKPVLLIIDMQNDFFSHDRLVAHKKKLTTHINTLSSWARNKQIPVVWIRQVFKSNLSDAPKSVRRLKERIVIEGTHGAELLDDLIVEDSDVEVIKKRYSGFYNTKLEGFLKRHDTDTLIVAGINTHACVRMTVIDAYQRDYDVIVARDCIDSWDSEHHKVTLKYFVPKIARVMSTEEIVAKSELTRE